MTPLYPQKLALTSPTGGGRSVGIVRAWTKATELLVVTLLTSAHVFSFVEVYFLSLAQTNIQEPNHVSDTDGVTKKKSHFPFQ